MEARIDADTRRRMIAEAAYFRAEQRGFAAGDPLADWIAAEAEIDAALRGPDGDELRNPDRGELLSPDRDELRSPDRGEPRGPDRGELLARIDDRVAEAGKQVEALRRKAGGAAAEARSGVQQELARISALREALDARGDEIREQGAQASRSLLEQAESLWKELTELLSRKTPGAGRRSARRK